MSDEKSTIADETHHRDGSIELFCGVPINTARLIRILAASGDLSIREIHRRINANAQNEIPYSAVLRVVKKDVPGYKYRRRAAAPPGLPTETVRKIKELHDSGLSNREIRDALGLKPGQKSTVHRIVKGERRGDV